MFDQQLQKQKGRQTNKTCQFKRNFHSLGYSGRHCETDINECYSDPCHYGTCIDGLASFSCQCKPGYTGRLCETNINECLSQPCRNGGTCQDRENAYICSCPKGTAGNKKKSDAASWRLGCGHCTERHLFSLRNQLRNQHRWLQKQSLRLWNVHWQNQWVRVCLWTWLHR